MKRQLKKSVVYSLYGLSFALLIGGVGLLGYATTNHTKEEDSFVSKGILDYDNEVKVVNTSSKIIRPYNDQNVTISKDFYDYKSEASNQEKSLIYYENTYIPSSGVSYSNGDKFDVLSILEGTVKEVKEDEIVGNSITIEHENGIVSIYQSISDILVKEGDKVSAGQILAKSSTSNISKELDNHLYFELIIDGICVNPEKYYNKSINELGA